MPPTDFPTENQSRPIVRPRTPEQQSFGTIVSIIIIVAMIVVGALYAWGKRVAEEKALIQTANSQNQQTY